MAALPSPSNDEVLQQLLALARELGLRRWGVVPVVVKLHLPDGREQVEVMPVALPPPLLLTQATPPREGPPGEGPLPPPAARVVPWHSDDYTRVRWPGMAEFRFTVKQASVIAALWDALEDGDGTRTQADLLAIAESDCTRLRDLFSRHNAWGSLIIGDGRGGYRLAPLDVAGDAG